ncbi:MAG TPA: DUF1134 domain-containing protein [Methyloceanibacter sp.]|nr:DUF1134 domain-containing protein [Methyloceanibacter sp.]
MRNTSIAIAATSAVLFSFVLTSKSTAQNASPNTVPVPNATANGAYPQTNAYVPGTPAAQPAPQQAAAQQTYQQQAYQSEQTYVPAKGYASEKLDGASDGFSPEEIKSAGHQFFGKVSSGFASAVEYTFQRSGRPNGYIIGEEAGGAFVAGLRYGEGTLHTASGQQHRVFWQGPSVGYDFGAEGSKTMVLVYNLHDPNQIYNQFAGVDGSAYLVGGVGVTYLARDELVLAPIRSGVGLRLGANVGYLKYTRQPTWNPF